MAMNMSGGNEFQSEINVTPLVDVVLVLLIIFMVIMPLTLRGYDVDIPGEATETITPAEVTPDQYVLTIHADRCPVVGPPESEGLPAECRVQLNDELLAVADLSGRVSEIFGQRAPADRVLFLAAQEQLNYEGVMRIVDLAKAGVADLRIGLVTEDPGA